MGVGGKKPAMHEIDDTRASVQDDAFDEFLDKIESLGGEITEDEEVPLYIDLGMEEFEVGTERIVKFEIPKVGKMEFLLTRKNETQRVAGDGRHKHLEPMNPPRIKMVLKRREGSNADWVIVDLEDLF